MARRNDRFWKLMAVALVIGVFYLGTVIFISGGQSLTPKADAQIIAPSLTQTHDDVLITSSVDGKTLYLWTFGYRPLLDAERYPTFQCEIPARYPDD